MAIETEVKISVDSFKKIKEKLSKMNAEHLATVSERNVLYDTPSGDLKKEDVTLRLRYEKDTGKGDVTVTFTVKGHKINDSLKKRCEFEVDILDQERMEDAIKAIGFVSSRIYEKVREKWLMDNVKICLDELPFGLYVEIEGDREDILRIAEALGFKDSQLTSQTYFEIAKDKGIETDIIF